MWAFGRCVQNDSRGTNSALKIGGGLRRNRGGVQRGGVQTSCFEGGELLELEKASYFFDGTPHPQSLFLTPRHSNPEKSPTVIICPGNGCTNIRNINWYGRLFDLLTQKHGIQCVCENFPDPHRARRNIWVPHVRCVRLLYFNIYFCNPPPHI